MRKGKKYTGVELMRDAPVGTAIIRLALPMMAAMLAQSIYNITDMFFIGQTGNPNMVAAVTLAFPLFMISQAVGNIFAIGGSSYISRLLGAKKNDEARHTSTVALYTAFVAGLLMTVLLLIFKAPVIRLVGASDATFAYTDNYLSVVIMFIAISVTNVVMSGQMRSEGEARKAMALQLIGITINIVLDPILILWMEMGTAGAAWATVMGQLVAFAYGIRYFLSKSTILSIKPADYRPNKKMMAQVLAIGIPAGLNNIIMSVSNILANRIMAGYGDHVVAGNGVHMRITSMFFMLIMALTMGYQPFAGFNYGAKQYSRLRRGFMLTLLYAVGLSLMGCLALWLFGPDLIRLFIDDMQTVEAGVAIMRIFIIAIPFLPPQVLIMVSFQALGKPVRAMVITMGRQLLFYVPLLYIFNHFFGFAGYTWTQPTADILTTGIAIVLGISLLKLMRTPDDAAFANNTNETVITGVNND